MGADPHPPAPLTGDQRASFALWVIGRLEVAPEGFLASGDAWVDYMTWVAVTPRACGVDPWQLRRAIEALVDPFEVCRAGYRGLRLRRPAERGAQPPGQAPHLTLVTQAGLQ